MPHCGGACLSVLDSIGASFCYTETQLCKQLCSVFKTGEFVTCTSMQTCLQDRGDLTLHSYFRLMMSFGASCLACTCTCLSFVYTHPPLFSWEHMYLEKGCAYSVPLETYMHLRKGVPPCPNCSKKDQFTTCISSCRGRIDMCNGFM